MTTAHHKKILRHLFVVLLLINAISALENEHDDDASKSKIENRKEKSDSLDPVLLEGEINEGGEIHDHDKRTIFDKFLHNHHQQQILVKHVVPHYGHKHLIGYSPLLHYPRLRLRPVKLHYHGWKPVVTRPHFRPKPGFKPSAPWNPPNVPPPALGVHPLKPWQTTQGWDVKPVVSVKPEGVLTPSEVVPSISTPLVPVPSKPVNAVIPSSSVVPIFPGKPAVTHLHPVKPVITPTLVSVVSPSTSLHLHPIHHTHFIKFPVAAPAPAPVVPTPVLPQGFVVPQGGIVQVQPPLFPSHPLIHHNPAPIPHPHPLPHPHPAFIHQNPHLISPQVPVLHHPIQPTVSNNLIPGFHHAAPVPVPVPAPHPVPIHPLPVVPPPAPASPLVPSPVGGVLPHPHGGTVEYHGKTAHLIPLRGAGLPLPPPAHLLPQPSVLKTPLPNPHFVFPGPQPQPQFVAQPQPQFVPHPQPQPALIPGPGPVNQIPINEGPQFINVNHHPSFPHPHPQLPAPQVPVVPEAQKPGITLVFPQNQHSHLPVNPSLNPHHPGGVNFDEQFHPHIPTSVVPNPQDQIQNVPVVNGNLESLNVNPHVIQPGQTDLHIPLHLPQHPNFRPFNFHQFQDTINNNVEQTFQGQEQAFIHHQNGVHQAQGQGQGQFLPPNFQIQEQGQPQQDNSALLNSIAQQHQQLQEHNFNFNNQLLNSNSHQQQHQQQQQQQEIDFGLNEQTNTHGYQYLQPQEEIQEQQFQQHQQDFQQQQSVYQNELQQFQHQAFSKREDQDFDEDESPNYEEKVPFKASPEIHEENLEKKK